MQTSIQMPIQTDTLQFKQYWNLFSDAYRLSYALRLDIYQRLYAAYTEPQRYYHSVQHIVECLTIFHQVKDQLNDPLAVEIALWFHDVAYQPQASDNEQQSAQVMRECCADILTPVQLEKVARWIEATELHLPTLEMDLQYLLDIDLAILASSAERFAQYQAQIRQEYSWVAPHIYTQRRMQILAQFKQQQPLYHTQILHEKLEKEAKENLTRALTQNPTDL